MVYKDATQTVGPKGPIVLQDWDFIEEISHFNRERIPERVVHAKGAGAFGYFEVTQDITKYTAAKVFEKVGKTTPIAVRFSQVAGNAGSADTVRDPRGFAIKFYTEDGIWDLVGNNTPIFFVRDPILFAHFIHTQKRNPATNIFRDWDMFWDFMSLRPETLHQMMFLFSDRGIPDGYRHMHGYGSHTFSLIDDDARVTYCKFHYRSDQGIKNLDPQKAETIAGADPDYSVRDLYNSIANNDFPTWSFFIQVMTPEEASAASFDPFDITKVWPQCDYPLIPVGRLILNKNPENYFAEIEQIAFSPSNMVPGIGPSPDRFLQGRLYAYQDAHRYRLGANYQQLAVNRAFKVSNFQRDGLGAKFNQAGAPNYHPNSFGGPETEQRAWRLWSSMEVSGYVGYYDNGKDDNYSQSGRFYREVLDEGGRKRLVQNLATSLKNCSEKIRNRAVSEFARVDQNLGNELAKSIRQGLHAKL